MSAKRDASVVTDVPPSPTNNKRLKSLVLIDPSFMLEGIDQPEMTSDQAVLWVRGIIKAALEKKLGPKSGKPKVIPSSIVDMTDIRNLLQVLHNNESEESMWVLSPVPEPLRMGTTWVETGLKELKGDPLWGIESCEALGRTLVDLLLFDRKRLLSDAGPFHALRMVGEYPITTQTVEKFTVISGRCDLVLGYGGHLGKKDLAFGLVAIEIKRRYCLGTTVSAQLVAYLVGLQQRRRTANKLINFVYGIATDGVDFIFHRLDDNLNLQCATVSAAQKSLIYRYIDIILESAMHFPPNTSPHNKSSRNMQEFNRRVEKTLWKHPIPFAKALVQAEDFDYVIVADENSEPCFKLASELGIDSDQEGNGVE